MKKALKINVETKTIESIEIGDWTEIAPAIGNGCQLFCVPVEFENRDAIYSDDESLLRYDDIKGGFIMENWVHPLVGNAIVIGTDEEGESDDVKTTIEELKKQIVFVDERGAKIHCKLALQVPNIVYSW